MKKIVLVCSILMSFYPSAAQFPFRPADTTDISLPSWARMMYGANPNFLEVERAFEEYFKTHAGEENYHTAYYKHWRRMMKRFVQEDGTLRILSQPERNDMKIQRQNLPTGRSSSPWNFVGPERNFRSRTNVNDTVIQISWHANMYCIDQSMSNTNVLYAGGENGGVYKSADKGLSWQYVSHNEDMTTVTAIAVNPSSENDVLVNTDNQTYRSLDGGQTWNPIAGAIQGKHVKQFTYNPANHFMVYAGTTAGLFRSLDGGNSWSSVFTGECHSVTTQPNNPTVVFALQYNPVSKIADFYKSLDSGATFIHKPTGWFQVPSADSLLIQSYGGCIATTEADSNRIYVLLVGSSQATAQLQLNGQIGIYRSDDGGETWSHPHGLIGAPYDAATHPNMMTFSGGTSTYNQIYYNTTLVASQLDPDKILIGGMSMWKSTDAAATYQPVGGYIGNIRFIHPDNQEFKIYKTSPVTEEIWFANDGGINYSTDFVNTHESRCNGLYGTAMWGFDQGWNDDILCGGRYHNGNSARRDGYPEGSFQQLGGGEAPTGYVNYSDEKKTYYSDIGGKVLPDTLNGITTSFPVGEDPNESYWDNNSSRIMFDWDYWNVAYLGKDNQILKSTNGGSSFGSLYTFGSVAGDRVLWIEQSRANTQVIYAQQVIGNLSTIWKSADRGISWSQISLPQNKRELCFTLSAVNADELWICYPGGSNGQKVYHSINSGTNWTNLTTPTLNGMETEAIAHQFGTDGGIYIGTHYGPVFYRNDSLTDWQVLGTNLPFISYPLRLVPFYRENKIRLATWHLGIWENDLYEQSELMADFSANYEAFYCPGDTIRFVPHSVASASATYQWTFPGANPSSSTQMYPEVVYTSSGNFDVSLVVSDNGSSDSITKTNFIKTIPGGVLPLSEGFESGQLASDWKLEGTGTVASNWAITATAGGFGASTNSLLYDNFAYDIQGAHDALWTAKYDFGNVQNAVLNFDVAYAPYGGQYMDTLEVLASIDCGVTFTSLYLKGGTTLATAPQFQSSIFIPDPTQWRTDTIDVSWLAGNSEVLFSFTNIGRWGQAIYVDNINLSTVFTQLNETDNSFSFDVIPNPSTTEISISIPAMTEDPVMHIFSLDGRLVYSEKISDNKKINIEFLADGAYYVVLEAGDQRSVRKFFKAN